MVQNPSEDKMKVRCAQCCIRNSSDQVCLFFPFLHNEKAFCPGNVLITALLTTALTSALLTTALLTTTLLPSALTSALMPIALLTATLLTA